jgi:hypothetical protein
MGRTIKSRQGTTAKAQNTKKIIKPQAAAPHTVKFNDWIQKSKRIYLCVREADPWFHRG